MTKLIASLSIITLVSITTKTNAQNYRHQLGVRIGSVDQVLSTGFTYKYNFTNNTGIEAILDLKDDIAIGALYEKKTPLGNPSGLSWYYGAGGYAGFGKENNLGITGILGMDYQFSGNLPLNVSIDWKPELNIVKEVAFRAATIGVSVRFSLGGRAE
jgi:outer membrane protein W